MEKRFVITTGCRKGGKWDMGESGVDIKGGSKESLQWNNCYLMVDSGTYVCGKIK